MLKIAQILLAFIALLYAQGLYAQNDTLDSTYEFGVLKYDDNSFHDVYGYHYGFAMAIGLDDFSTDSTNILQLFISKPISAGDSIRNSPLPQA